jgi:hypothetical protein
MQGTSYSILQGAVIDEYGTMVEWRLAGESQRQSERNLLNCIWGSHGCDSGHYRRLGCNAVQLGERPMFRRKIPLPSPGLNNKPSKKRARSKYQAEWCKPCFLLVSCLASTLKTEAYVPPKRWTLSELNGVKPRRPYSLIYSTVTPSVLDFTLWPRTEPETTRREAGV